MKNLILDEIIGGTRDTNPVYVFCNGHDVSEMSSDVANGFGRSADYVWLTIRDLRCDSDDRERLLATFPNLSEEAYRAILNINVRGMEVKIFYYKEDRNNLFKKLIGLRDKLREINYYKPKLIDKLNKVLRKNGENEIVLDELFKF
jgi:hypothetical protein